MAKYTISIPDANKLGIRISGVKIDKNPFKILGSILLSVDRGGFLQYTVKQSDFPTCFPIGEHYWSITDMFCNACNSNIHTYKSVSRFTEDFENICFLIENGYSCIFSKHKVDDTHWKVLIYDSEDEKLYSEVVKFFEWLFKRLNGKYEFKI